MCMSVCELPSLTPLPSSCHHWGSQELVQVILLTFWSNTFLALSTPVALSAELETSSVLLTSSWPPVGPAAAARRAVVWLTLADCILPQVLLSFQSLGLLQQALSVRRMRSWQQPSGLLHCCSWKCRAAHALGADFYLWGLKLTDVILGDPSRWSSGHSFYSCPWYSRGTGSRTRPVCPTPNQIRRGSGLSYRMV